MRIVSLASFGAVSALVGVLSGCQDHAVTPEEPVARIDLRAALAADSVEPVGVAIASNGDRFVFDQTLGLYQLTATGAVRVMPMSALPDPGTAITLPITDIVAISPTQFAITAIGDGFLLDTTAMTLHQHFCYVPDGTPEFFTQRTDAIAFDAESNTLYAQPVTTDDQGRFAGSQLASYNGATGESQQWYGMADRVAATGMTLVPGLGLLLGQDARLDRLDLSTGETTPFDDLERFGVHSIDGLALDRTAQTLIVVDRTTSELVEIDLARLAQ